MVMGVPQLSTPKGPLVGVNDLLRGRGAQDVVCIAPWCAHGVPVLNDALGIPVVCPGCPRWSALGIPVGLPLVYPLVCPWYPRGLSWVPPRCGSRGSSGRGSRRLRRWCTACGRTR